MSGYDGADIEFIPKARLSFAANNLFMSPVSALGHWRPFAPAIRLRFDARFRDCFGFIGT